MRANEFITEAPLPPKAQQVLWRLKHGLNQPGLQLTAPRPGPQQPRQADPAPATQPESQPQIEPVQVAGQPRDWSQGFVSPEYQRLHGQIQRLQQIQAQFVELERLIDRAERQPGGIDRGTQADIDIIRDWPVPETDEDMAEYSAKLRQGIDQIRNYLQRKKVLWRR